MAWQKTPYLVLFLLILSGIEAPGQGIDVRKLEISNPGTSEFAPVVQDSMLYFISNRRTNLFVTYLDQNNELLFRIFRTPLNADGTTGKAELFSPPDQPRYNAGPLTFSANGAMLIATHNRSERYQGRSGQNRPNRLTLYTAQKREKAWNRYQKLNIDVPPSASIGQPSLSADGNRLFFVSDMEDGYGDTDIYVSHRTPDGWSTPENTGPDINTPGKELFPFIHPSGKLYFSSDGHNGAGNLDIYYVNMNIPGSKPVPLPEPVNTIFNDFSCYIGPDEKHGFFASDRDGDDDIYKFSFPQIACSDPQKVEEDNFCFTFFENGPFKSDTLPYIYRWDFGDGHEATGLEVDHCFEQPGQYQINLNVIDTLLNEQLFSVASYNLKIERKKQIWFETPDTINTNFTLELKATLRGYKNPPEDMVFYWDFGNGETRIGKKIDYTYHKAGRYRIICSTRLKNNREVCFFREIEVTDPQ
ncbi:PKD domain-containing protein [Anaerophaga thermohalophila]|uniref:PKD domain-containing protein n=1 Tax=Anaerophaga thermohalophila TaxID=177400 RepID=UPI000237BA8B|nr:PKD domain-containing protein [Anaerophaga thermohalophila]